MRKMKKHESKRVEILTIQTFILGLKASEYLVFVMA